MNRCTSCSAPLRVNELNCQYCGVRNALDLQARPFISNGNHSSHRNCPECKSHLTNIDLGIEGGLSVERCESCFGIFFDKNELEHFLEKSTSNIYNINREQLKNISEDRFKRQDGFKYRNCPECDTLMHRKNFGYKSGVIVDLCGKHGIWLDNGELTHLLEWRKAGGKLLHEQKDRLKNIELNAGRNDANSKAPINSKTHASNYSDGFVDELPDLVGIIGDAIASLLNR